ncbi:hypothetical protein B6S08_12820 [Oceanimonas doudoroffii]|uniref:Integrase n=2 Tax=Oceanimonas doudoroffii TaxID=84158 RepID=A0A233RDA3_9GAMM|nr:hypothetical protein B6S08_12820 [Oceanimonas doudoroffii]
MPIRILGLYWKSYIDFFDDLNVKLDNWKYVSSLPKRYKEYIKENNIKDHNNNWLYYVDEFCQDSLRDIYFDKDCKVSEIIIRRSDDDVRDYENNNYTYQKIVDGRLVDVPLARTSYNRRFPQYYVDIEQIYIFYHRAALIACETIQSMTGMRLSESNIIKFGALIDENGWVGVKSKLFKYAGEGGVEEWWAASPYIKIVFSKVRGLAKALFNVEEDELDYLYIKTDARHFITHRKFRLMKTQRNSEKVMNWTERNNIYITEEDTEEFWKLNPNIAEPEYVESVIYPGAKWPVTPHQFRRSIAVHVRRLELVTMRQLASHLKHLGKTLADWYSDGSTESSMLTGKISSAFAKELERADLERAATMAMKFQNGNNLFGRGGEILEKQKHVDSKLKTYQSYQQAKSLAKRRKSKLVSLGNGMYCMNGTECDFKAVSQSANCRPDCENLVADKDSIPIWKRRYEKFRLLYLQSIEDGKPEASREFFRLEMESYKQALEFYGIIL